MSLKSKMEVAAVSILCWLGLSQNGNGQVVPEKKRETQKSTLETAADSLRQSVRDSIMQALQKNYDASEDFGHRLSKPWQRASIKPGKKAPEYGNDPLLARQLLEGDLTMRDDYLYYRNLSETLLNFKTSVDDHCLPDENSRHINKLRANQSATKIIRLRTGSSRDDYLKKEFGIKLCEKNHSLIAEYKKYAFEVGKDGKAVDTAEIQNPARVKDVLKKIKTRGSFVPKGYQPPVRQF